MPLEQADQLGRDAHRELHRLARAEAHDLDVRDRAQSGQRVVELLGRQRQRVAAGDQHVADLGVRTDVGERLVDVAAAARRVGIVPVPLADAEAAVGGAEARHHEQHPIGVAVRQPGGDLIGFLAERIDLAEGGAALLLERREDHAPDRIFGIGGVDQAEIIRCHREAEDAAERIGGAPLVLGEIEEARQIGGVADGVLELPADVVPAGFWDVGPGGMPRRWQSGSVWDGSGSR